MSKVKEDFSKCNINWDDDEDDEEDGTGLIGGAAELNMSERSIHRKAKKRYQEWLAAKQRAAARGEIGPVEYRYEED